LLLNTNDPQGATDQLEAGARVHGWDPETRYLRALAAARAGRFQDAITVARELTRDPERGSDAELLLVHLMVETGDVDEARRAVEAGLRGHPDSTDLLLAWARIAEHEGKTDEQLAALERARALDPDNLSVRTWHGVALVGAGRRAEGQRELARVVAQEPGNPIASRALIQSTVPSRRAGLGLLAAYFLTPALAVLAAWLVASLRGGDTPSWLPSLYVGTMVLVMIGIRTFDRVRTDRHVAAIRRDAHRRPPRGRRCSRRCGPSDGFWSRSLPGCGPPSPPPWRLSIQLRPCVLGSWIWHSPCPDGSGSFSLCGAGRGAGRNLLAASHARSIRRRATAIESPWWVAPAPRPTLGDT
jgi:hypothetical protein